MPSTAHISGIEFEIKLLNIDVAGVTEILKKIGGVKIHSMIEVPTTEYRTEVGYVRVSETGGGRVQLATKLLVGHNGYRMIKNETITIDQSYETANHFIDSLGIKDKAYRELFREKWYVPGTKTIYITEIPGIPTYMRIVTFTEASLNSFLLHFEKCERFLGTFADTYEHYYGIDSSDFHIQVPELSFKTAYEILSTMAKKDKLLLQKVCEDQRQYVDIMDGSYIRRMLKNISNKPAGVILRDLNI
jgi:hypothetical protein